MNNQENINAITIDMNTVQNSKGLNKYILLQSFNSEIREIYENVFDNVEGSLTTVADNDTKSKINIALTTFYPNDLQIDVIRQFEESFKSIEKKIDPERLQFNISKGMDEEILISRSSDNGVSNIILNEDGLIAYSFIAYKNSGIKDVLDFHPSLTDIDFEYLTYKFFSL